MAGARETARGPRAVIPPPLVPFLLTRSLIAVSTWPPSLLYLSLFFFLSFFLCCSRFFCRPYTFSLPPSFPSSFVSFPCFFFFFPFYVTDSSPPLSFPCLSFRRTMETKKLCLPFQCVRVWAGLPLDKEMRMRTLAFLPPRPSSSLHFSSKRGRKDVRKPLQHHSLWPMCCLCKHVVSIVVVVVVVIVAPSHTPLLVVVFCFPFALLRDVAVVRVFVCVCVWKGKAMGCQ